MALRLTQAKAKLAGVDITGRTQREMAVAEERQRREARGPGTGDRSQESGVRSQGSGDRRQGTGDTAEDQRAAYKEKREKRGRGEKRLSANSGKAGR